MARPVDVAPSGPLALPITGLGRGWEAAALMILTVVLLSLGLVTLYSASAFLAQRQTLPDYYYVLRQATGAAMGLSALGLCAWAPPRSLAAPGVAHDRRGLASAFRPRASRHGSHRSRDQRSPSLDTGRCDHPAL